MRKTLLAVSSAVLLSMLLAPHGGKGGVEGWGPFFSGFFELARVLVRFDHIASRIVNADHCSM
jgi:hypothetical protein